MSMKTEVMKKLNMDSSDVVEYLKLMEEENHDAMISQWGEDIAYGLYKNTEYPHLEGYVMYYIFEIVTENIKMHHFGRGASQVCLKYYDRNTEKNNSYIDDEGSLLSRTVKVTSENDMRGCGNKQFTQFIKQYIRGMVELMLSRALNDDGFVYVYTTLDRLEYAINFLTFAVNDSIGVITQDNLIELRDETLEYIESEIEKVCSDVDKRESREVKRGNFLRETVGQMFDGI